MPKKWNNASAGDSQAKRRDQFEYMSHETSITRRLVDPWMQTNFTSVETDRALANVGLRFIGVVKAATRCFKMSYLSSKVMDGRGKWYSMIHKEHSGA
eukprot:IDg5471t1